MGHPQELLKTIAQKVAETWSESLGYRFEYEKPLYNAQLRMFPDIQVIDKDGTLRCVVEIGYTRPEKLTKYRQLGIKDVRWYDKEGMLHGDVEVKTVIQQIRYSAPPSLIFKCMYFNGCAVCDDCLYEKTRYACACNVQDPKDEGCGHDDDCEDCDHDSVLEDLWEECSTATTLIVVSNGERYLRVIHCDECDRSTVNNDESGDFPFMGDFGVVHEIHTPMGFEQEFRRRERKFHHQLNEMVQNYRPGEPLMEGQALDRYKQMLAVEQVATFTYDELINELERYGLQLSYDDFKMFPTIAR